MYAQFRIEMKTEEQYASIKVKVLEQGPYQLVAVGESRPKAGFDNPAVWREEEGTWVDYYQETHAGNRICITLFDPDADNDCGVVWVEYNGTRGGFFQNGGLFLEAHSLVKGLSPAHYETSGPTDMGWDEDLEAYLCRKAKEGDTALLEEVIRWGATDILIRGGLLSEKLNKGWENQHPYGCNPILFFAAAAGRDGETWVYRDLFEDEKLQPIRARCLAIRQLCEEADGYYPY